MANKVGWGQGSVNNNVGWGKGASNNDIGWGNIQSISPSGETNIVGGSAPVEQLLLDEYPNAAAAYSLRDLASASVGSAVVRVRRIPDNVEQDFTATEITDGTLTTFTGANDGFVTTWYDQSGNSVNVVQATATSQPQLVDNGVVILDNEKPTVFYGLNSVTNVKALGTASEYIISQPTNYFSVARLNTDNTSFLFDTRTSGSSERQSVFGGGMFAGTTLTLTSNLSLKTTLYEALFNSTNSKGYIDNVQMVTGDAGLLSQDWGQLGNYQGASYQSRSISELIIYPSDQTTNRTGINANLNAEYKIFPDTAISGLLFDYPNASAAYSLRQLTFYQNGYIPDLVRVRRSSDNLEQDFNETEITDGTLASFCSSTDGFVVAWYDQSSNNNHAVQASAGIQPKLVSNGVVILENGKPAIETSSSTFNGFVMNTQITSTNSFVVCKSRNNAESNVQVAYGNNNTAHGLYTGGTIIVGWGGIVQITSSGNLQTNVNNTNQKLISVDITNQEIYIDSVASVVSGSGASSFPTNIIGGRQSSGIFWHRGTYQEFIFYPTDQSANRTGIETNINTEYTIY